MLAYFLIMLFCALTVFVVALLIYRGNVGLVHTYHTARVKDKPAYGRAMGKVLFLLAGVLLLAGTVGLFSDPASFLPTGILLGGMGLWLIPLLRVQKKYNGGVF